MDTDECGRETMSPAEELRILLQVHTGHRSVHSAAKLLGIDPEEVQRLVFGRIVL